MWKVPLGRKRSDRGQGAGEEEAPGYTQRETGRMTVSWSSSRLCKIDIRERRQLEKKTDASWTNFLFRSIASSPCSSYATAQGVRACI